MEFRRFAEAAAAGGGIVGGGGGLMPLDPVEPLYQKCIRCVASRIFLYENELSTLPPNIKERLLKLLCQRGKLNNKLLSSLVNNRTKSLSLSACPIDDDGIKSLSSCESLRRLDLNSDPKGYHHQVTTVGIQALGASCKYLQHVGLRRCLDVDDAAIVALANGCPLLRRMNICGLVLISDLALDALGKRSSHLESIDFSNTNGESVEGRSRRECVGFILGVENFCFLFHSIFS